MKRVSCSPQARELGERIGDFIAFWGFKRVHGKIWTHLALSARPLDAAELIRRIGISKALVSMSIAELMKFNVIEESGKSARSTQLYRANPDFWMVILNVLRIRERQMLQKIHAAQKAVHRINSKERGIHNIDHRNSKVLGALISATSQALEGFIQKLRFDLSAVRSLTMYHPLPQT